MPGAATCFSVPAIRSKKTVKILFSLEPIFAGLYQCRPRFPRFLQTCQETIKTKHSSVKTLLNLLLMYNFNDRLKRFKCDAL